MVDLIKLAKKLIAPREALIALPAGRQNARPVSLRHACAKKDTVFDILYAECGGRYVRQESRAGSGGQFQSASAEVPIDLLDLPACPGCGSSGWIACSQCKAIVCSGRKPEAGKSYFYCRPGCGNHGTTSPASSFTGQRQTQPALAGQSAKALPGTSQPLRIGR